jgi:hypothetical protein
MSTDHTGRGDTGTGNDGPGGKGTGDKEAELYPFTPPPPRPGVAHRRRRRSSRLTKTAAGLAVILGAGAGAAAVASAATSGPGTNTPAASASATPSPGSPSPVNDPTGRAGPARRGLLFPAGPEGPMVFGPYGMLAPNGPIHGTFTVKGANGGYETIDTQYGTAEAVSSSSITVKSADGFSQTYAVSASTTVDAGRNGILSVKVGDTVSIQGLVSGSTIKAEHVLDVTQAKANGQSWGPGHPFRPGGPGGPGGSGGSGGTGGTAA